MKDFHVFLISFKPVIMMFEAKESRGLRLKISSNGRLNRQELTIKRLSYMRGLRLLRIIINFAMVANESQFNRLWEAMRVQILQIAEEYGDQINAAHAKKKPEKQSKKETNG